jgi:hypothetical protein
MVGFFDPPLVLILRSIFLDVSLKKSKWNFAGNSKHVIWTKPGFMHLQFVHDPVFATAGIQLEHVSRECLAQRVTLRQWTNFSRVR